MSLTHAQAVAKIDRIFSTFGSTRSLVGGKWTAGKVYEAWVLSAVLRHLQTIEGFRVTLIGGTKVHLKSSPGPINPAYPRFRLTHADSRSFEVWTDVEFSTLSFARSGSSRVFGKPPKAFRHELDIVLVATGTAGYPGHDDVVLGIECKNTGFSKAMARAALGVRRELSYLSRMRRTSFHRWPRTVVPANPHSILLVFSTDPDVVDYNPAGEIFGVDFYYEPVH